MSPLRMPGRPLDRRTGLVAVVLSFVLPGLGHAYAYHLPRALVWMGGAIVLFLVLDRGRDDLALALAMTGALSLLAAGDAVLAMWLDGRAAGRR